LDGFGIALIKKNKRWQASCGFFHESSQKGEEKLKKACFAQFVQTFD